MSFPRHLKMCQQGLVILMCFSMHVRIHRVALQVVYEVSINYILDFIKNVQNY